MPKGGMKHILEEPLDACTVNIMWRRSRLQAFICLNTELSPQAINSEFNDYEWTISKVKRLFPFAARRNVVVTLPLRVIFFMIFGLHEV